MKHVFVIISVSSKWTYDLLPIHERFAGCRIIAHDDAQLAPRLSIQDQDSKAPFQLIGVNRTLPA